MSASFPDCSWTEHSGVKPLSQEEFAYVNWNHFHLANVQIICDAQMQLTNFFMRWPGSAHKSLILTNMVGNRVQAGMLCNVCLW